MLIHPSFLPTRRRRKKQQRRNKVWQNNRGSKIKQKKIFRDKKGF